MPPPKKMGMELTRMVLEELIPWVSISFHLLILNILIVITPKLK